MLMESLSEADITLTTAMHWVEMKPVDQAVVTVAGRLEGDGREDEGAALLVAEFDIPIASQEELENSGLYLSEKFGPFAYVQANGGPDGKFSVHFTSPSGRIPRRIGLRLFRCEHPVQLLDLTITVVASTQLQHPTGTQLDPQSTAVPVEIELFEPMLSLVPTNAQITLTANVHWVELTPSGATIVTVAGHLVGDGREIERAALLTVEFSPPVTKQKELANSGLYLSERFGPFAYVQAQPDGKFSLRFTPPVGHIARRIGLQLFRCEQPLRLSNLTVACTSRDLPEGPLPQYDFIDAEAKIISLEEPANSISENQSPREIRWLSLPDTIGNRITLTGILGPEGQSQANKLSVAVDLDPIPKESALKANGLTAPTAETLFAWMPVSASADEKYRAVFSVPDGSVLTRVGLISRNFASNLALPSVSRAIFTPREGDVLVNISIDVEALPGRATGDHVDSLIYGRDGNGEYGIPLQMRVFHELGVPATFYLECGQCALWGVDRIGDVAKLIQDSGFDLQLHLHSELLARAHNWKWTKPVPPMLQNLDRAETFRAIGYAVEHFHKFACQLPDAFRAGAYLFSPHTLEALHDFGIPTSSNYRADQRPKNAFDFEGPAPMRPFKWSNGVYEFPITLSPEPLTALPPAECWRRILHHVQVNRTWVVNVVIHSWSFMHRDKDGHHVWRNSELKDNLIKFIELAPAGVRFASIAEITEAARNGNMDVPLEKDITALISRQT